MDRALAEVPCRLRVIPSCNGHYVLLIDSIYDETLNATTIVHTVKTTLTGEAFFLADIHADVSPIWLEESVLLWGTNDGSKTRMWFLDVSGPDLTPRTAGCLLPSVSSIKSHKISETVFALVFASNDGGPSGGDQKHGIKGSGRLYESLPIRFGRSYLPDHGHEPNIYLTRMTKNGSWYEMSTEGSKSILEGLGLSIGTPLHVVDDSFEVGPYGLLVRAASPEFLKLYPLGNKLYFLRMDWQNQCRTAPPQSLGWDEWTGSPSSFSFSNDGLSVVLLMSKCADACFGHDSIFVADLEGDRETRQVHISKPSENSKPRIWYPRIVSVFRSSSNLDVLYAVVDAEGQMGVWKINMFPEQDRGIIKALAKPLLEHGSTTFLCCLGPPSVRDELLVSRSTFQRAGVVEIVTEDATSQLHIQTVDEYRVPQPPAISDQFYFPSAGGLMVQAFIHKPAHFTEDKRYPVVIIVHGGPNDAWRDCWLATWNHLAWTSQGFVVITPNIRGSTGFGLPFALSIYKDWGGSPLRDLEYLISFIEASMPFADLSRVIGAGYSYGGYLINWLAGQELSRRFCALIVHGGVFSPRNLMAGDFPLIYRQDFGCFPWEGRAEWDRWDPSLFCDKWTVPMLFICGDVDYRVPVSETLAAYHACQIRGVPSQLLLFPDEGHRISKPANLAQWRETMLAWAIRWTAQ